MQSSLRLACVLCCVGSASALVVARAPAHVHTLHGVHATRQVHATRRVQVAMVGSAVSARVVQGATQGAVGAVVAAGLSAFTEPVVNRILVKRISVRQSIKELDVAKSQEFFLTTLPTNFLKFPLFEAVNAAMTVVLLPDSVKGAITGLCFTTATLPVTNYRFCKSMELPVNTEALFKAYLPTVMRDVIYGIARNKLSTALRLAFPLFAASVVGRPALLFPVVFGACLLSSPGNELRGFFLQPKEQRKSFQDFFQLKNYLRSTLAGGLIMAISLTTGSAITGPLQTALASARALVSPLPA